MRIVAAARDLRGDERRQKVIDYLGTRMEVIQVCVQMPRLQRVLNLCKSVAFNREIWRERSKKNSFYFRKISQALRCRILRASGGRHDVILLFESLFSPGIGTGVLKPYVIYEDSTSRLALQGWPRWVPDSARRKSYQDLESTCYRGASRILTTNEPTRTSLIHHYGVPEEVVVNVGQGHDFEGAVAPLPYKQAGPILFVGYEFDRKGGPTLISAFRRVRQRVPNASLVIVGPELTVREPGVTILGRVCDKRKLRALYETASVFALPSVFDPMPHAVLEAMAFGLPSIISSGCGTVELIEDGVNGFMVPPHDENALAERLVQLLTDDELRRRIGQAGAETVRQRCQWKNVAQAVGRILENVAEETANGA